MSWDTELKVYAKANSGNQGNRDSATDTHLYEAKDIQLGSPSIQVSGQYFSSSVDTIAVTLTDPNPASFSSLVWWFDGQDEALATPPAMKVHALLTDVDRASIPGTEQAAELRMRYKLFRRLFRQVAVTTCDMDPTDAELANLPVWQGL